ncbi:MAG: nicotinate-nucleotide adenylyltransferase [Chroococcidiopsidaceae cyanobacterium CP_BM_ER_R8_30]|nr:nicotinate-nucleotide adenylyltransferase [Chroococcidiopsidaceae cyanobacterium CP_BM_ER_R8_30]
MRIALFGTSADPPTSGHQVIIDWLSRHYDWVAVWAADNPFKSHQTPLEHRAAMLQIVISEIDPPRHNVGLHPELSSERTLLTVERAKERWGTEAELTLVIGSDLVSQLVRWYRVKDLLRQVQLLVVPRPGYAVEAAGLQQVQRLGGKIAIADLTGPAVSSTAYREHRDPEALTPPVEAYIHREHLYKCQDATQKSLQIR